MTARDSTTDPAAREPFLSAVQTEWLRRVEAEYRSAAATQHMTLWLFQLGAPSELLRLGLRVAEDELTHAELSAAVYAAAGGQKSPQLERETLQLHRSDERLELDLLHVVVEQFCLGETVAVRLFSRMRCNDNGPHVRTALDRILRDEVVHRDFGWQMLEWLLETPLESVFRARLQRDLPAMLARVRLSYGELPAPETSALRDDADDRIAQLRREWGMLAGPAYVAAVEETFGRDYQPRFAALDVVMP